MVAAGSARSVRGLGGTGSMSLWVGDPSAVTEKKRPGVGRSALGQVGVAGSGWGQGVAGAELETPYCTYRWVHGQFRYRSVWPCIPLSHLGAQGPPSRPSPPPRPGQGSVTKLPKSEHCQNTNKHGAVRKTVDMIRGPFSLSFCPFFSQHCAERGPPRVAQQIAVPPPLPSSLLPSRGVILVGYTLPRAAGTLRWRLSAPRSTAVCIEYRCVARAGERFACRQSSNSTAEIRSSPNPTRSDIHSSSPGMAFARYVRNWRGSGTMHSVQQSVNLAPPRALAMEAVSWVEKPHPSGRCQGTLCRKHDGLWAPTDSHAIRELPCGSKGLHP